MATLAIGLATSLVAAAAALLVVAAFARPRGLALGELLRVYPDLVRLLAGLSRDRRVGRAASWRPRRRSRSTSAEDRRAKPR